MGSYLIDDKWKSPVFMPRKAARIFLEVTGVNIERLQDITLRDIEAEGIEDNRSTRNAVDQYKSWIELWDAINAKKGYGWDTNPFVYKIVFKKVKKE